MTFETFLFFFMNRNINQIRLSHTRYLMLLIFLFFLACPAKSPLVLFKHFRAFSISEDMFSIFHSQHSDRMLDLHLDPPHYNQF